MFPNARLQLDSDTKGPAVYARPAGAIVAMALAVVWTVAMGGCGGSDATDDTEALRQFQQGVKFQEQGDARRAGDAFTFALMKDPKLAEAWARRAWVFYVHQNLDRALEDLDVATNIDPDLALAYNYRGLVYYSMEEENMAALNFTKAIDLDPSLTEAFYNRARLRVATDDLESAIDDLSSVIALEPQEPKYYMERAQLHLRAENPDMAAADLERVLSITQDEDVVLRAKQMLASVRQNSP